MGVTRYFLPLILLTVLSTAAFAQGPSAGGLAQKNLAAGKAFMEENRKKEGVIELPNGLQYRVINAGSGPKPKATDTVSVHYRGTLIDGSEFESSARTGKPASFRLDSVLKGLQEALPNMSQGSKWQIVIPPELGYGEQGAGGKIGPNETMVFDIELVGIGTKTTLYDIVPRKGDNQLNEALIQAAEKGDLREVRALIAKGADVNAKRKNPVTGVADQTALTLAYQSRHMEVVLELLNKGADINAGWLPPYAERDIEVYRANIEINRVYKHLMSTLNPQQQKALREEDHAWIKWRDAEADRIALSTSVCCGSAYRSDYLSAMLDLIRKRTEILKHYTPTVGLRQEEGVPQAPMASKNTRLLDFTLATRWEGEWHGTQQLGERKESVVMRLRREGDKLEGQVIESPSNTSVSRAEVRGSIKPNGEFQIDSRDGLRWYGKVSATGFISGVKPNGPPEDPTVPKFPFTLNIEKTLPNGSVATTKAQGPPTARDWHEFIKTFRVAVTRRDATALRPFIANHFYLRNGGCPSEGCSPEQVLVNLEQYSWDCVSKALTNTPKEILPNAWRNARREILDEQPYSDCGHEVSLVFERDDNSQWHWISLDFPGD